MVGTFVHVVGQNFTQSCGSLNSYSGPEELHTQISVTDYRSG